MSRVFVTGGTGFLGSAVVRQLLSRGHKVAVLQRPNSLSMRLSGFEDRISVVLGSVNSRSWLAQAVAFQPEIVIHAAWEGVVSKSRDDGNQRDNLLGIEASLELAGRSASKKWIGLGSQAEYGNRADSASEATPPMPNSRYGETKVEALKLSNFFCDFNHIEFAWVRAYSLYGPADNPEFLVPFLVEKLLNGELPDLTLGEQKWDYLYVEDAAEAIVSLAETTGATGIFNLGSGSSNSLRTLIEHLRDRIDPTLPLGFGNVPYSPEQVFELKAEIAKLHAATGWLPATTWEEGLEKTIAWYRAQRTQRLSQS